MPSQQVRKRKRDNAPVLENIGYGQHKPFIGRYGRTSNIKWVVLGDEARSHRTDFVPVIIRNARNADPELDHKAVLPSSTSRITVQEAQLPQTGVGKIVSKKDCIDKQLYLNTGSVAPELLQTSLGTPRASGAEADETCL